jgi:hypothetical protein
MGIKRAKESYARAKARYHQLGDLAKKKGPQSWEAEVGYPEAKAAYKKAGERLHTERMRAIEERDR